MKITESEDSSTEVEKSGDEENDNGNKSFQNEEESKNEDEVIEPDTEKDSELNSEVKREFSDRSPPPVKEETVKPKKKSPVSMYSHFFTISKLYQ